MKASLLFRMRKGQTTNVHMLYSFVLLIVLVGMVIGIGIIVIDNIAKNVYYTRKDYNDTVTIANYTAQKLDFGNITVSAVWNDTSGALPSACYSINTTPGTFIYTNETATCDILGSTSFYVIYDFKEYDTETKAATANVRAEVANISSDWIGLIVTITILSIILGLVLLSFRPGMERG